MVFTVIAGTRIVRLMVSVNGVISDGNVIVISLGEPVTMFSTENLNLH